jgi:hypothetical protein
MNKDDLKILQSEYDKTRVSRLSDRPNVGRAMGGQGLSAQELKARMDASSSLIVERFNALIEALAGVDEDGERCEGVADLIMTGLGDGYSLADLFAGLASGEAAQRIKAGIGEYTLKGYLQYIKQITDELEKEQDTVKDTVSKTIEKAVEEAEKAAENAIIDELGDAREAATVAQNAATTANAAATRAEAVLKEAIGQAKNDKTLYANALKGTATGEAVGLHDVSPLPHEMAVKVSGVEDISAVKVLAQGKNLANIYGFSADSLKGQDSARKLSNSYGTTISTTEPSNSVEITQTATGTPSNPSSYTNGFFHIGLTRKPLEGEQVTVSFDVNITNNPLNVDRLMLFANDVQIGEATTINGRCSKAFKYSAGTKGMQSIEVRVGGCSMVVSNIQLELGGVATDREPAIDPTEYTPNADGTVDGVTALHPTTTLMTDTEGAVLDVEYNRDINKAFEQLVNAIISQGGNV